MLFSVVLSLLILATLTYGKRISVANGGPWGDWGILQRCPTGTVARGFSLKVEQPLGLRGDDTALNAIRLYCTFRSSKKIRGTATSTEGPWGVWTPIYWCPSGYFISFTLKVEERQNNKDDTAANNIKMRCSDGTFIQGNGGPWGNYGTWSGICLWGICGITTKVEPKQYGGDDTALNNVQFECC